MAEPLDERQASQPAPSLAGEKKSYSPPSLVEYGSIAKLTQKKGGSIPDGKSGMTMVQKCL